MKTKTAKPESPLSMFRILAIVLAAQAASVGQARADDCIDASRTYVQRASEARADDGSDATQAYLRSVEEAAQAQGDAADRDCD